MQKRDEWYFSKYSVDPESELDLYDVPDDLLMVDVADDNSDVSGLDEMDWFELD
jgi:hypothetical protein